MINGKKIVVDAGHGGADCGAVGHKGLEEAEVNLYIAKKLKELLEQNGAQVWLTRTNDSSVELKDRVELASKNLVDLFISIHCNATADKSVTGIETICRNGSQESFLLAKEIQTMLISLFKNSKNRGVKKSPSEGYKRALFVLKNNLCPSVLIECEFISNPDMELMLRNEKSRDDIATAILLGICNYLNS